MRYIRTAALAAIMTVSAMPAFAQRGTGREMPREGMERMQAGATGVEAALRMREELKLSASQVNQLEALRKEIVTQRQNAARDMIDLRSRIEAGHLEREAARKEMESRRDAMRETMKQRREQFEKILTDDQRDQLREDMRRHGRRMEMRGERGPRGFDRGFRGPPPPPRSRYRW